MTPLTGAYKVIWDLVKKTREEDAMRDGLLTAHDNFHNKHYMETVADGNSDYWRSKVLMIRNDLVARIGETAFYDFIDAMPDSVTYQDIHEKIVLRLKDEITPNFISERVRSWIE